MGYSSTMRNFEQFPFQLPLGTTREDLVRLLNRFKTGEDYGDTLSFWFAIELDEDGYLELEPVGESGKAYDLPEAVDALIQIVEPLQTDSEGLAGLRLHFELWGEEAGDATLYRSDGKKLYSIRGETIFSGDPIPVS